MRYVKLKSTALLCKAQEFHRGGLGAKKSPRWSAERRASPGCADCVSWSARGREAQRSAPAGLRHWSAKGASQAPERLSALRSLVFERGESAKLGGAFLARTMRRARMMAFAKLVMRGIDPRIHRLRKWMDCRISPLRAGPAMTKERSTAIS